MVKLSRQFKSYNYVQGGGEYRMVNTKYLQKYGIGGYSSFVKDLRKEKQEREEIARKAFETYQKNLVRERLQKEE